MLKRLKKNKGFTLIELIVVIVILGILALVTVPSYLDISDDAKDGALKGQLGTIRAAIALQYAKNAISGTATYPDTISSNMFSDNQVPSDAYQLVSTVVTANPITFDDTGGWRYNPSTGEVRANVSGKHSL